VFRFFFMGVEGFGEGRGGGGGGVWGRGGFVGFGLLSPFPSPL